jgi:hypothetical protein
VGKTLKPYQGLKRTITAEEASLYCRKNPKTLSGIETGGLKARDRQLTRSLVGKTLKPYQGLKQKR